MAGYYDQLMAAGGSAVPINPHTGQPVDFRPLGLENPGFLASLPPEVRQQYGLPASWGRSTSDGGANRGQGFAHEVEGSAAAAEYERVMQLLSGWSAGQSRQNYEVTDMFRAPDGSIFASDPFYERESFDRGEWGDTIGRGLAVVGAVYGGGLAAEALGAGAATGAGASSGVSAGAIPAATGGATTFPVAAGGAGWGGGALGAEGLASSVASLNAMALPAVPTLTGAAGGAGAVAGAGASAGINGYLTTGAAEGSTVGNFFTGAGGQAGAVGSGTSASYLQSLGNFGSGVADFFAGRRTGTGGGLRSAFDIVSGLYGLKLAGDAREASDPFGSYRGAYGAELAKLEANPSTITSRPGWKAGIEAIQRNNNARGYAGSGNEMAVMSRYGGEFFNNEVNRLATLAGAGAAPGAGAFPAAQLTGQGLASIGYGLAPYMGGPR